jgi:hypothetical protein
VDAILAQVQADEHAACVVPAIFAFAERCDDVAANIVVALTDLVLIFV